MSFDIASTDSAAIIHPDGPLKIYFAHPITTYGTQVEQDVLDAIKRWVGADTEVVNPNQLVHQENYRSLFVDVDTRARAFEYFLYLARQCNFCVFLPFEDRLIGSGVAAEIQTFFDRFGTEARVYEWIPVDNHFRMRHQDYFATPGRVLTVEETRKRINQLRTKNQ